MLELKTECLPKYWSTTKQQAETEEGASDDGWTYARQVEVAILGTIAYLLCSCCAVCGIGFYGLVVRRQPHPIFAGDTDSEEEQAPKPANAFWKSRSGDLNTTGTPLRLPESANSQNKMIDLTKPVARGDYI